MRERLNLMKVTDSYQDVVSLGRISTYINPYQYLKLRNNKRLLNDIDQFFFDGKILPFFFRVLGFREYNVLPPDMSGFIGTLFDEISSNSELSVFLVGGSNENIERASAVISQKYPHLKIIGKRNGYFKDELDIVEYIKHIVSSNPSYILVGMGATNQEIFLSLLKKNGYKGCGIACGGFFHQTAKGDINYYPMLLQKLNLRWIYRMWDEPKLIYRYFCLYPISLFVFIYDLFCEKIKKSFMTVNILHF